MSDLELQVSKLTLSVKIKLHHMTRTLAIPVLEEDKQKSMEHIEFMVRNKLQEVQHNSKFGMRRISLPFEFELEWDLLKKIQRIQTIAEKASEDNAANHSYAYGYIEDILKVLNNGL